ncbi:LYR motif-containing protein [archaeon]|nr:MAG: LYR motif-containing protein [archaeon]
MSKRILGETLPLRFFIRRKQVLSLYRNLIRNATRVHDESVQRDIISQIRTDFRRNAHVQDSLVIKSLIQEGNSNLKILQGMAYKDSKAHSIRAQGSWIEQEDPVDKRGRVGEGWPWS